MEVQASEIFQRNFDALYEIVNVKVEDTDEIIYSDTAFKAQAWVEKNKKNYSNLIITDNHRVIENVGGSRCHAPGTLIRMYDGSLKKVEDIQLGDKVASYDGLSFNIVNDLHNGIDDMFLIKQGRGDDYIVNKNHLLSVKQTRSKSYKKKVDGVWKEIYDAEYDKDLIHHFSAEEWSKMSLRSRRKYSGFKNTFLELPETNLPIDPYYLGLWLGDGSSSTPTHITTGDKEIVDFLEYIKEDKTYLQKKGKYDYNIRSNVFNRQTELSKLFYKEDLIKNKHIPQKYIYTSYQQRLQLLAGLIDSDGHQTKRNTLVFSNINKTLIDNVYELLLISGFYTNGIRDSIAKMKRDDGSIYKVKAYAIEFNSPDFSELNKYIKLERKRVVRKIDSVHMFNTKIESHPIGKGKFYGFSLDNDTLPLYKLKDGTITHNSSKTWSIIQLLFLHALTHPGQRISIVRKTLTALTKAMSKDIEKIIDDLNIRNKITINKTSKTYSFPNGSMIELMGANDADRLRGTARDVLFVDEATELLTDDWLQLIMRTRVKAFISYNPAGNFAWIDSILPANKITIHSTYKDNPFLPYFQIKELLDLKEVNISEYNIYALGQRSITKENIYDHFRMVKEKPERFTKFIYGLDFGYNHPTALVKTWYYENEIYIEPVIYQSYLNPSQLIEKFRELNIEKNVEIPSDYSRPEIIDELINAGYQCINADKKVLKGINLLKATKVWFNEKDEHTLNEYQMYKWKKIRDIILDEPVKQFDDIMDAVRYANMWIAAYYR